MERHTKFALRTLIVSLTAAMVVCGVAGAAGAAPPRIVTIEVDFSFPDSFFTDLCGIEVEFFHVGTLNAKLFVDQSGTIDHVLVGAAVLSAVFGASLGNQLLPKVTMSAIQWTVAVMLFLIGVSLIVGLL